MHCIVLLHWVASVFFAEIDTLQVALEAEHCNSVFVLYFKSRHRKPSTDSVDCFRFSSNWTPDGVDKCQVCARSIWVAVNVV